ncbi:hypothetical protein [uncultured Microbacterium sp.]|uniref:hypothetical protein n=1 Tax=uncultured Microbacterium sp. TaxID=191216 RepID=UPI0025FA9643|nr:hypothetical protein [uncultured Microbacterium sp.]
MDDDVELRALRERVYGVDGASATPEMLARLAQLEDRHREEPSATPERAVDATDAEPAADPQPTAGEPKTVDPAPTSVRRRAALWAGLAAVGAVVCLGLGTVIGAGVIAPAAAGPMDPQAAAAAYPELTFPQTVEDVISADILRDSGIDPSSTRYIATVDDFRIYLAQPDDGDGICIATFTSSDNRPWSVGCASGGAGPSAAFGVDADLTVAVGEPDPSALDGIPTRLSDSVTAFVAR